MTELGYDVLLPITESAEYDIVVDDGDGLHRVQCKYISGNIVDLRKIHSNSQGYVVKLYSSNAFDWLYVYSKESGEYLYKYFVGQKYLTMKSENKLIAS